MLDNRDLLVPADILRQMTVVPKLISIGVYVVKASGGGHSADTRFKVVP